MHHQLFMDLSLNLRGIVAQQLIKRSDGKGRFPAIEILINTSLVADIIRQGEIHRLKEVMKSGAEYGMQTFDQALFNLYKAGKISHEDALNSADSRNDVRLMIKLASENLNAFGDEEDAMTLSDLNENNGNNMFQ
jgi:twitching motility protein PilU